MTDAINSILNRIGVVGMAIAIVVILIFGFAVWGIAHYQSEPGKEVSVLWGLVSYTKQNADSQDNDRPETPAVTPDSPGQSEELKCDSSPELENQIAQLATNHDKRLAELHEKLLDAETEADNWSGYDDKYKRYSEMAKRFSEEIARRQAAFREDLAALRGCPD